jgi:hypothetical protein
MSRPIFQWISDLKIWVRQFWAIWLMLIVAFRRRGQSHSKAQHGRSKEKRADQASVRRALGKDEDWYPSSVNTVERQFDETCRRIRN